ncbi:MAG TPA: WD40 repeat domain-containing protein, partial [Chthoniobacteraceae bacterium]|nr:WD40 repeat domain-containing protein [Chthoniobacteraceae bacterium]
TGTLEPSAPREMESSADRLVASQGGRIRQAGYVQVWDAVSGAAVTPQLWGEDEVQGVCLSPDGTLVCALERGGLVRIWSTATGRECIDPLPHMPAAFPIWFSGDGKRILTVNDGVPQFHELWGFGGRAPAWLPDLAEAIGGLTLNDSGVTVPLDRRLHALDEVRKAIVAASGDDLYLQWARWFFADRRTRNISPVSQRTMSEELAQKP